MSNYDKLSYVPDERSKVLPCGVVGVEGANQFNTDPTIGTYLKYPCVQNITGTNHIPHITVKHHPRRDGCGPSIPGILLLLVLSVFCP